MTEFNICLDFLRANNRYTTAKLSIKIDDVSVWPRYHDESSYIEIQIDDILTHLSNYWQPLLLRQNYPLNAYPRKPSSFREEVERRWGQEDEKTIDDQDEVVWAFEQCHNISNAFCGIFDLPYLWIMRNRENFIFDSPRCVRLIPFRIVVDELIRVGDLISERLMTHDKTKWADSVRAWNLRNEGSPASFLRWSAGVSLMQAEKLIEKRLIDPPVSLQSAANDNDELVIAARGARMLTDNQIEKIIEIARSFPVVEAPQLEILKKECQSHISEYLNRRPSEQGERAAHIARNFFGIEGRQRVEIFDNVKSLGIEVRMHSVDFPGFGGIAVMGAKHGPGVFLNTENNYDSFREEYIDQKDVLWTRVNLAHELCHLMLDGAHTVAAVEVLKGRIGSDVEARAKSFAGEFLLPGTIARDMWVSANYPTSNEGLLRLLQELVDEFGVTMAVASWKLEHGVKHKDDVDLRHKLSVIVPQR